MENGAHPKYFNMLLLALASSADNFTVGLAVGVHRNQLESWANITISACNAFGALVASLGGQVIFSDSSSATLLVALAFGYLSSTEMQSYRQSPTSVIPAQCHRLDSVASVMQLALPMTLNNLAGGVAGGSFGVGPFLGALYAFVASFACMWAGHALGRRVSLRQNPSLVASILYGTLCLFSLWEEFVDKSS